MALSFINAGAAEATTITIPASHQNGDLLIIFSYRKGNTTSPTAPAGWTSLNTGSNNTNSARTAFKIAVSSSDVSGTWTNATGLVCHVYRGVATNKVPCGNVVAFGASNSTVQFNTINPMKCPGTSLVAAFVGHSSIDTTLETAPAGMVNRANLAGASAEYSGHDTSAPTSSWPQTSVSVGGTSGDWRGCVVEIFAEQMNIQNYMSFDAADGISVVAEKTR